MPTSSDCAPFRAHTGSTGFFDAVDPRTNRVGHCYLVLDNVLQGGAMRDHFARDPVIQAARPYLATEEFSLEAHQGESN